MTTISIVTICYNDLNGLRKTWDSVQSQTFHDFQWIVADGNSRDGSQEFLQGICDDRLSWKSEPDQGIYDAMNKGMARASGDYLFFLNSGDTLATPDTLALVADEIERHRFPDFLYGDAYEDAGNGHRLLKKARSHTRVWYGMFTHHQSMFYKRAFIAEQRYPLDYRIAGDYAFTAGALIRRPASHYMPHPICLFEPGGVSQQNAAQGRADVWRVQAEVLRLPLAARMAVRTLHLAAHAAKRGAPAIYNVLRFKRAQKENENECV